MDLVPLLLKGESVPVFVIMFMTLHCTNKILLHFLQFLQCRAFISQLTWNFHANLHQV